jgi:hypothetical protein
MRWILVTMAIGLMGCEKTTPVAAPPPVPMADFKGDEPYSFQEFTVGKTTLDDVKAAHPAWEYKEEGRITPGMVTVTATDEVTVAGSIATKAEFRFLDGTLFKVDVLFPREGFGSAVTATKEMCGVPKENGRWENETSSLRIVDSESLNNGRIQIDHTMLTREALRRVTENSEKEF